MSLLVKNIDFAYKNKRKKPVKQIFENFSASFEKGKITAITGPNGSGKTTLSKLILGILKIDKGQIIIDNEDTKTLSLAQMGRRIGYVMQNPAKQIFCTTVKEEMAYGLQNMGLPQEEIEEKSKYLLDYFDISQYEQTFPFSLSQGEKQRLALAAVLAMEPEYLMLDEPTAALDLRRKAVLSSYLKKIKAETGCGIIFISHDKEFIADVADETVALGGLPCSL